MSQWQVEQQDDRIEARCDGLRFAVTPNRGLSVEELAWTDFDDLWTPVRVVASPFASRHYDRYELNTFANCLQGEADPLEFSTDGERFEAHGRYLCGDISLRHALRADAATGEVVLETETSRSGPGSTKMQTMHELIYRFHENHDGPHAVLEAPVGGRIETLRTFEPAGSKVLDQDGHSVNRARMLSEPHIRLGLVAATAMLRCEEDDEMACCGLRSNEKVLGILVSLYGRDFIVERGAATTRRLRLIPERLGPGKRVPPAPVLEPERRGALLDRASDLTRRMPSLDESTGVNAIRRRLIEWKLREFSSYMASSEYDQCDAMLADADRAFRAVEADEPAELPELGDVIYENDFRSFPLDWDLFGFCKTENDPERGFHLEPNMTTNMWTQAAFEGNCAVEFDFCPTSEHFRGGTFLQMCGQCINPRDAFDFMASAMGHMSYYNFGIKCYHYSFNRGDLSVCNFRKTGQAFYLLSQIEEPVRERGRWYRLRFAKRGRQFLFFVDDILVLEYFDEGNQGEVYESGRIGIRNWGRQTAWFRDFRVYRTA